MFFLSRQGSGAPVDGVIDRDSIHGWIDRIRAQYRIEVPDIAKKAKVSASTIYRWLDEGYAFNPSMTSLRKIAQAFDVAMPGLGERDPHFVPGFSEGDVQRLVPGPEIHDDELPRNQSRWRITSRVLELAGFLPGDDVIVDMSVQPRSGDVVCAQVRDLESGSAKTRLRLYEPPFLTTRTMDPTANERPLYVDNERVYIMGTVIRRTWTRPE